MKPSNDQDAPAPGEMNRYRLAPETPALEHRVLRAARDAWQEASESGDIPWTGPILKFAASLAFAISIIFCADHLVNRQSAARWQVFNDDGSSSHADPVSTGDSGRLGWASIASEVRRRNAAQDLLLRMKELRELEENTIALK